MWRVLNDSVIGTSHRDNNTPCQDFSTFAITQTQSPILLAVCSDGAGSAAQSHVASRRICQSFVQIVVRELMAGLLLEHITPEKQLSWLAEIRQILIQEALSAFLPLREFASTFLSALVGMDRACFAQIGDGAIVYRDEEDYQTVFWPARGEFANTTFFLTDENFSENARFACLDLSIEELALFTDGLESLALSFGQQTPHSPFFAPLFQQLRQAENAESLQEPLRQFLDSEPVNQRTDDDKTLLLAVRGGREPLA